jgi:hypothetical protein
MFCRYSLRKGKKTLAVPREDSACATVIMKVRELIRGSLDREMGGKVGTYNMV